MNDLQKLQAIYNHIRDNGTLCAKLPGSMGGIWGADTYDLGPFTAQLCDDGSTQAVRHGDFLAWSTYGREVEYRSGCDATGLDTMYQQVFAEDA